MSCTCYVLRTRIFHKQSEDIFFGRHNVKGIFEGLVFIVQSRIWCRLRARVRHLVVLIRVWAGAFIMPVKVLIKIEIPVCVYVCVRARACV